jgi:hypothetical protein
MVSQQKFRRPSLSSLSGNWRRGQRWSSKCLFTRHSNAWCNCQPENILLNSCLLNSKIIFQNLHGENAENQWMTSNIFADRRNNLKSVTSDVRGHFSIVQNSPVIKTLHYRPRNLWGECKQTRATQNRLCNKFLSQINISITKNNEYIAWRVRDSMSYCIVEDA